MPEKLAKEDGPLLKSEKHKKHITCNQCGRQVSTPVPSGTQIRAWVQCYKCEQENSRVTAITQLISSVRRATIDANWCDEGLAEAIIYAEKCLPKHLR